MSRLTPLQHDWEMMIRAMELEQGRIGAADEALTRRIVRPDNQCDNVHVHTSGTTDPAGQEATRRVEAQQNRDAYRNSLLEIWTAIKAHRRATDAVLHNEPVAPQTAPLCVAKDCTHYASQHTNPDTGLVIEDMCDDCWRKLCPRCWVRPVAEYRTTCFACYQRQLRRGDEVA